MFDWNNPKQYLETKNLKTINLIEDTGDDMNN